MYHEYDTCPRCQHDNLIATVIGDILYCPNCRWQTTNKGPLKVTGSTSLDIAPKADQQKTLFAVATKRYIKVVGNKVYESDTCTVDSKWTECFLSENDTELLPTPQEAPDSTVPLQTFASGATRGTDAIPFHLVTPHGTFAVAEAFAEGAKKYGAYNNLKGFPLSNLYDHAMFHLLKFWWCKDTTGEDELGHALWNIAQMIMQQAEPSYKDLDDRPPLSLTEKAIKSVADKCKVSSTYDKPTP